MAAGTHIEWTEATWNPVTGCTRVSEGCDNCYAVAMTRRIGAMGIAKYDGLVNRGKSHFNGHVKLHRDALEIPQRRSAPTLYFVNSMSDLFHDDIPDDFIADVFEVMAATPRHTYQILTKRPERMASFASNLRFGDGRSFADAPLPNVWLGTSVENQQRATERIPVLASCPAAVRFLSCEPLLSQIDIGTFLKSRDIHWVIVGGESGPRSRPLDPDWVRMIQNDCASAGVAFFFKQWGGRNKRLAGRLLDGETYNEMPAEIATPN